MVRSLARAAIVGNGQKGFLLAPGEPAVLLGAARCPFPGGCLGDGKRASGLAGRAFGARARPGISPGGRPCSEARARSSARAEGFPAPGIRFLSLSGSRCRAVEGRALQFENSKSRCSPLGSRTLYFDTHAFVCLLEENGFTTQQSEIIVSAVMNIMKNNMDMIHKDMVTKMQQEIAVQQIMSHIGVVKKDMIILEKSEFSALRAENEKIKFELQQLKKQVMDETSKVRTDSKLDFNLEKSRVKELYSLNDRKVLKMRTEIVELHAQQDRALTQTYRKIDTEVAGLKTMLESHKLDNIKYLAGSVFTCLTVALGFYRLWI
ncbi:mitochondrial calcium uniporter regulator 1 isoform X1 [Thamnophis elegans]|uniref:mitochondrial calcium uniporter regulator 1 isoform X1 n=1 Tax=Thamnophis elegans TaxID=35005 RepID=UPI001377EADB|nr:mitochondrial calcium uniporter regulator 1 isoform X1 [Thamnophis elegans]